MRNSYLMEGKSGNLSVVKARNGFHLKKKCPNLTLIQMFKSRDFKRFMCKGDITSYGK